jgi:hypothetical protein
MHKGEGFFWLAIISASLLTVILAAIALFAW